MWLGDQSRLLVSGRLGRRRPMRLLNSRAVPGVRRRRAAASLVGDCSPNANPAPPAASRNDQHCPHGALNENFVKVCFISHSARLGGAEMVLLETVEVLRESGVGCYAVLPSHGPLLAELEKLHVPVLVTSYALWSALKKFSLLRQRSEERRVGKEGKSRVQP